MSLSIYEQILNNMLSLVNKTKEDLLTSLKVDAKVVLLTQSDKILVWGMPFYQHNSEDEFDTTFKDLLSID